MAPPRDEEALSEVVGFVLLLGVIVLALSVYQVYAVPAQGRENEIMHMNLVKDRFTDYKIALDSLWVNNATGVTLSMAFDLGSGSATTTGSGLSIPLLSPVGSSGAVSVASGGSVLTITADSDEQEIPLGSLQYVSGNNYWVDQTWTYEMGGVFLTQTGGTTVRVSPPFSVYNTGGNASVSITPVNITGSSLLAGSGPVRIESRLRNMPPYANITGTFSAVNISIDTGDEGTARAWRRAFAAAPVREGIPTAWYEVSPESSLSSGVAWIRIDGSDHVTLLAERADYLVSIATSASLIE
ncbi:DUF7289 family protein [Methanofollis fontis]|uniref:Uncharacterized protein n=1 Tax=Methanofollis fontis TaxID=2052832 RepID=A0A483CKX7_9EURY|nr:hypothetical protein [Methanofollis fontis]TAJ43397.1 hypothetical protein CUJ86_11085 [Methanofollis fontis]